MNDSSPDDEWKESASTRWPAFATPASDVTAREEDVAGPPPVELTAPLPSTDPSSDEPRESFVVRNGARLLGFGCALLVCVYYAWLVAVGDISKWPPAYDGYFGMQANAFAAGQLHLLESPRPELVALADPYEPSQNHPYRMHDALLHKGKDGTWRYYFYWGPVPALMLLPFKLIPAVPWKVPDYNLTLGLAVVLVLGVAAVMVRVRERWFAGVVPWWVVGPCVLAAGLVNPLPYTMARASIYEGSIIGAHALMVWGIFLAMLALDRAPRWWLLAPAGLLWGLAVGTRVSLAPAVVAIALVATLRLGVWWRGTFRTDRRRVLFAFAGLVAPLVACAIGLAVYNFVRFGSFMEFGVRYQLAGLNMHRMATEGPRMMDGRYVRPNLLRYLFEWGEVSPAFPFLTPSGGRPAFIERWNLPRDQYGMDKVVGVVPFSPWLCLGAIAVVALFTSRRRFPTDRADRGSEAWLTMSLLVFAVVAVVPSLFMTGSVMRYMLDGSPYWSILAAIGVFQWVRWNRNTGRANTAVYLIAGELLVVSIVFGLLLGMTGDNDKMRQYNPELWQWMTQCGTYLRP
jgi:hypothetical protein